MADLHAFITKAETPGPGIPLAVEDSIHVQGMPTTYGSLLLQDAVAQEDDLEIARIRAAGYSLVGKTNLSEFSFAPLTQNRLAPPTINPHTQKTCLGSSGGAAVAVAIHAAVCSIGTDSVGGLRLSAYDCGLFGLKPTRGRIPICRPYLIPNTEKLLHQKGLIAQEAGVLAQLLNIVAKPDARDCDCCSTPPKDYFSSVQNAQEKPLTIGFSFDLGAFTPDPQNRTGFELELSRLQDKGHATIELSCNFGKEMLTHCKSLLACDRYFPLLSLKEVHPYFMDLLDAPTCSWFCLAQEIMGIEYAAALFYATWLREEVESLLNSCDLFLTPCLPGEPSDPHLGPYAFMLPFNLSGHPALVLPSGAQAVAKPFKESDLLSFAALNTV